MKIKSGLLVLILAFTMACKQESNSPQSIEVKVPQWLSAHDAPSDSIGSDKDHYIDRTNGDVYEKANGTWELVSNFKGDTGETGTSTRWLSGSGIPSDSIGNDNDLYLDNASSDVFIKIAGSWSFQSNIKGVTGAQGATGQAGANGENGLSTIAGKTVQTAVTSQNQDVLTYDQTQDKWIAKKVDLTNTTGNIAGSRVTGNITGNATSITGFIDQVQVNGLGSALSNLGSQITSTINDLTTTQTDVADLQANKANATDVTNLQNDVALKANSSDLATLQGAVALKAETSDLTALSNTVDQKANSADLGSLATKSSVTESDISGTISNSKIAGIDGSKVSGDISGNATSINGAITESQVTGLSDSLALKADASALSTTNTNVSNKLDKSGGTMTGDIQLHQKTTTDESSEALSVSDKAKVWFNSTVNRLKFWDGSDSQQVAVKAEVDTKADSASLATTDSNVSNLGTSVDGINTTLSGLGSLAIKNTVTESDITGTISNSKLAGIDGSKVSGNIGGNIGDTVQSSALVGFIDGVTKSVGTAISHVTSMFTDALSVFGDASVSGTLTSGSIVGSTSIKVGANEVLTTASTITSNKIDDANSANGVVLLDGTVKIPAAYLPAFNASTVGAISTTVGASDAGKVIKTNSNGYLDSTMLGLYYETGKGATNGFLDAYGIRFDTSDLSSGSANYFNGLKIKATTSDFTQAAVIDVQGQIVSRSVETVLSSMVPVDFRKSNTMSYNFSGTSSPGSNVTLIGLVDGGSYTLVFKNVIASGTLPTAFTISSIATGTTPITASIVTKANPALASASSGDAIYNFLVVGNVVYVTWMNGFL